MKFFQISFFFVRTNPSLELQIEKRASQQKTLMSQRYLLTSGCEIRIDYIWNTWWYRRIQLIASENHRTWSAYLPDTWTLHDVRLPSMEGRHPRKNTGRRTDFSQAFNSPVCICLSLSGSAHFGLLELCWTIFSIKLLVWLKFET